MKKSLTFISLLILLVSCSDEQIMNDVEKMGNSSSLEIQTRTIKDGRWGALGYGYDIVQQPGSPEAFKYLNIVDVNMLMTEEFKGSPITPNDKMTNEKIRYGKERKDLTINKGSSGEDFYSYLKEITTTTGIGVSVANTTKETSKSPTRIGNILKGVLPDAILGNKIFSASATVSKKTNDDYSIESTSSYAYQDVRRIYAYHFLHAPIELYRKYLDPNFKARLNSMSTSNDADRIIKEYGTHVVFDMTLGGYFRYAFSATVTNETTSYRKKEAVEAGAKLGLFGIGLGAAVSGEKETYEKTNNKNTRRNEDLVVFGGDPHIKL